MSVQTTTTTTNNSVNNNTSNNSPPPSSSSLNDNNNNGEIKSILNVSNETASSAVNAAHNLMQGGNSTVKTPISLLQEICMKCKIQPVYEVVSTEGQVHEPIFVYKVTIGDISSIGKGTSKKRAKHSAALSVLNEIKLRSIGKNDQLAEQIENLIKLVRNDDLTDDHSDKHSETGSNSNMGNLNNCNPVGELLEITQKYAVRPPTFEFGPENGPPHAREFVCYVQFGEIKEIGVGKAKKDAKRQAALKLLNKIKAINKCKENGGLNTSLNNSNSLNGGLTMDDQSQIDQNLYQQLYNKEKTNTKNVQNTFYLFKHSDKPIIKDLITTNKYDYDEKCDLNLKLLDDLSKEHAFEYAFFKIPIPSKSAHFQILLQLKIHPLTVIHGCGMTLEEAKIQASFNAVSYIKILSSR